MSYGTDLYAAVSYASADGGKTENPETDAPDLMRYLPDYYTGVREMEEIQTSCGLECGRLRSAAEDGLRQANVGEATWGLERWEREVGLSTNPSQSDAARREMITAKLRGAGTTTPDMIRRTASAFSGGDVEVREVPGEYRFEIHFVGTLGIPLNMPGLIQMIEEIKPAHLDYSFVYSYTWWNSVKSLTWGAAKSKTWNELRVYEQE